MRRRTPILDWTPLSPESQGVDGNGARGSPSLRWCPTISLGAPGDPRWVRAPGHRTLPHQAQPLTDRLTTDSAPETWRLRSRSRPRVARGFEACRQLQLHEQRLEGVRHRLARRAGDRVPPVNESLSLPLRYHHARLGYLLCIPRRDWRASDRIDTRRPADAARQFSPEGRHVDWP